MLKNISTLGIILSKKEQKSINGGIKLCNSAEDCGESPFFQFEYTPPTCINGQCNF